MSITQAILDEIDLLYTETLIELHEAMINGSDNVDAINDEVKAIAQTYNDIATGNVQEIS